jgi:hypothetical protein
MIVSGESPGFFDRACDVCFQNTRKSSRWKPQQRLWLDKEKGLFPGPNHASQEHQEQPVRLPINWSLDLSMEDDELLSYQCVFCNQFRFSPGNISERAE